MRLRRSELATPASSEKMMAKAATSVADLVFLDLEDAVAPNEKVHARGLAVEALKGLDWGRKTRAVRINGLDTEWALDDVVEVVRGAGDALDMLIVPKPKRAADLEFVSTLLDQLERGQRRERPVALEALVEEAEAVLRADELARSTPRLEALIVGFGDLSASQGVPIDAIGGSPDYPGDLWHYARVRTVLACKASGIEAVDGPFPDFSDPAGYTRQARMAKTLGFAGKWAIHPSQIGLANEAFSPAEAEVAHARRVVEAYAAAQEAGQGAVAIDGKLIDVAVVRAMEHTVRMAEVLGR